MLCKIEVQFIFNVQFIKCCCKDSLPWTLVFIKYQSWKAYICLNILPSSLNFIYFPSSLLPPIWSPVSASTRSILWLNNGSFMAVVLQISFLCRSLQDDVLIVGSDLPPVSRSSVVFQSRSESNQQQKKRDWTSNYYVYAVWFLWIKHWREPGDGSNLRCAP